MFYRSENWVQIGRKVILVWIIKYHIIPVYGQKVKVTQIADFKENSV
jgi:hypothetical protein